jgi:hypothetical protein
MVHTHMLIVIISSLITNCCLFIRHIRHAKTICCEIEMVEMTPPAQRVGHLTIDIPGMNDIGEEMDRCSVETNPSQTPHWNC